MAFEGFETAGLSDRGDFKKIQQFQPVGGSFHGLGFEDGHCNRLCSLFPDKAQRVIRPPGAGANGLAPENGAGFSFVEWPIFCRT